MSSLGLLKAKKEEKLKEIKFFLRQGQNQFAHFGGLYIF